MCAYHLPKSHDRIFLADIALGLVFGCFRGGQAMYDGHPHHRLWLHLHPVQEMSGLDLLPTIGLQTKTMLNTLYMISIDK